MFQPAFQLLWDGGFGTECDPDMSLGVMFLAQEREVGGGDFAFAVGEGGA